jgi:cytochrome c oxidase subunit 3
LESQKIEGLSMGARAVTIDREAGRIEKGPIPQRVYPTGTWIALCGILMFFAALVSAWVVRKGLSTSSLEGPLQLPRVLLLANFGVLLASSAVLEFSRRAFRTRNEQSFSRLWLAATALGCLFLVGQLIAWRELSAAGLYASSNPDASFFYLFTGAHAIHLLGGIVGLLLVALRPLRHMTLDTATRVAAMYWHFLTLLWAGILLLLMVSN